MDDIVKAAMAKWPNVPACYGWLGLDARGNWHMRDDAAQALGGFASGVPGAKGSLLQHRGLIDFIQRNYGVDERGCYYFQNGPQRVFVDIEAAPWVLRISDEGVVSTHAGDAFVVEQVHTDEQERLYFAGNSTQHESRPLLGVVHTQDVLYAAELLEQQDRSVQMLDYAELQRRYRFVASPHVAVERGL